MGLFLAAFFQHDFETHRTARAGNTNGNTPPPCPLLAQPQTATNHSYRRPKSDRWLGAKTVPQALLPRAANRDTLNRSTGYIDVDTGRASCLTPRKPPLRQLSRQPQNSNFMLNLATIIAQDRTPQARESSDSRQRKRCHPQRFLKTLKNRKNIHMGSLSRLAAPNFFSSRTGTKD